MAPYEQDELKIEVDERDGGVLILWQGISDAREPGASLTPFLQSLLGRLEDKEVTVDFRPVRYMNSATVSPIIHFMKQLDERGIQTTLLFDPTLDWQRVNAKSLQSLSRLLRHVRVRT